MVDMLTENTYFGPHIRSGPPEDVRANAVILLDKVNALLADVRQMKVVTAAIYAQINSGWRPAAYNAMIQGAAPKSKHITGQAVDLADPGGELDNLLLKDYEDKGESSLLVKHGLYMEHPSATPNWVHLQSVAPRSGRRIFYP